MQSIWQNTGRWMALGWLAAALSACGALGTGGKQAAPTDDRPSGPPTATPEPVAVSAETTAAQLETFEGYVTFPPLAGGQIVSVVAIADSCLYEVITSGDWDCRVTEGDETNNASDALDVTLP